MKSLLFVIVSVFASMNLWASDVVECNNIMTARCLCKAPMVMKCGSMEGNVKSDAPLKFLKVIVKGKNGQTREVTLKNPPGGIRDYYAVSSNDWVSENIRGLKYGDEVHVAPNGYGLDSKTPLYSDFNGSSMVGTAGGKDGNASDEMCVFVDELPLVVEFTKGCSKKICSAKIKCKLPDGEFVGSALCPARPDGSCPTATECAMDEEIQFSEPAYGRQKFDVYDSKTGSKVTPQ